MAIDKNYKIIKLVAKGGTAELHKAIQTSLDRVVAVKKLHQHLTEDENFTRRFRLEARAAASLDHDNIVKIIDFGVEDGVHHMIMEFIEGESLHSIIDRWRQVPVDVALAIVYEVLKGLEHAHAKGIVHRDIKPGNIMLTREGRVKITDFGLAKLTQGATHHTAANSIMGTPLYMSPEQAYGENVDHRSDLFSLGTMLYEMITGVQPFRAESYMAVIQHIVKKNAPHPSRFNIEVPTSIQSILSRAMNKNREARFQSAGDFRKAIEKYMGLGALKEASESLKHLLSNDGATMLLPKTVLYNKRTTRIRRGFGVALGVAVLVGAAGIGYSLAPETVHQGIQGIVSWMEQRRQPGEPPGDVMGGDLTGTDPVAILDSLGNHPPPGPDSLVGVTAVPDTTGTRPPRVVRDTIVIVVPQVAAAGPDTSRAATPDPSPPPAQHEDPPVQTERTGWLSVSAEPGAEIYIDGRYRADSPPAKRIELISGEHTLECRFPNYETYTERVRITAGELSTRTVIMRKLMGTIALQATEGAQVFVDGKLVGVSPLKRSIEVDAGDHQLTVKKAGFNVWNNQITVHADEELRLKIKLSPIY